MQKERAYRRFTWTYRQKLEALYNAGHTYRFIAAQLGFTSAAIFYEVKHGLYEHMGAELTKRPWHYSAEIAQQYAESQATSKGVQIKLGHRYDYAEHVADEIALGHSPDAITGTLRRDGKWTVSTTTLYRYIDQGFIPGVTNANLLEKSRRKRKYNHVKKAKRPPKGTSIERRPDEITGRTTFGHWELDSVIGKAKGKKQSVLVLTERLTRYEIVLRAHGKTSAATVSALDHLFPKFPKGTFKTITVDNGSEFQDCQGMEHDKHGKKRTDIYYCHPYTSCERGSNECANRIIRRFLPKGQSMHKVTQKECDNIAAWMNALPRKILAYATADELFQLHLSALCPSSRRAK